MLQKLLTHYLTNNQRIMEIKVLKKHSYYNRKHCMIKIKQSETRYLQTQNT